MYLNGTEVPETLSTHVATTIGDTETLITTKKIRIFNCSTASISFVNTGADDTTYSDIVLDIVKLV